MQRECRASNFENLDDIKGDNNNNVVDAVAGSISAHVVANQ